MPNTNEFGQPVGGAVDLALPRPVPGRVTLRGEFCTLQPLDAAEHAAALFTAYAAADDDSDWTYLGVGPFRTAAEYRAWAEAAAASPDPLHFAVVDNAGGAPLGTLSPRSASLCSRARCSAPRSRPRPTPCSCGMCSTSLGTGATSGSATR